MFFFVHVTGESISDPIGQKARNDNSESRATDAMLDKAKIIHSFLDSPHHSHR